MMRVFIANAKAEERSALRFMMLGLKLKVVGEASDWQTTLTHAPTTNFNLLLVDWTLLPANPIISISAMRRICSNVITVVLTSHLDAHEQAAQSSGADAFVSKGEIPNRLADHLLAISRNVKLKKKTHHGKKESQNFPRSIV